MSDNDLIRRGDALAAVQEWTYCCDAEEAIAALPAVTVGAYTRTGVMDKDGREICVGDRILIDLTSNSTKRKYWRPEYEVVFKPPHFTLKHVGGDEDSDTARFYWRVPQPRSTEKIMTLRVARLDLMPAPLRYMGQIMAECDCPREAECQAAGRCIAEGK